MSISSEVPDLVHEHSFRKARCQKRRLVRQTLINENGEPERMSQWTYVGRRRKCRTLHRYENEVVFYHGKKLHDDNRDLSYKLMMNGGFVRLSTFKQEFMDKILSKVEEYLPDDDLTRTMAILNQRHNL